MDSVNQVPKSKSVKIPKNVKLHQFLEAWRKRLEFVNVVNSTLVALFLFLFFGFPSIHKQARTEAWKVDLRGANLHHANLENAEQLNTVNWSGAVITEETIFPSNFSVEDAKQNGAFFIPSPDKSLDNYPFTTNISNINLRGFNLTGANLSGFNLKYADMAYATLKNAKLENSNMAYSNLEDADLSCVNLKEVNLTGAYLGGANLSGADLSNQDKLKADDLYRVRYDEKTIFPFNNTPPPYAIKTALDKDCQKT